MGEQDNMKNNLLLASLAFFFSIAFLIFSMLTYFTARSILINPFDLSDNYVEMDVFDGFNRDLSITNEEILNQMHEIIKGRNVTLIIDTGGVGLGLFDGKNIFATALLEEGHMFLPGNRPSLVVRKDSYTYDFNVRRMGNDYMINNTDNVRFTIYGTYNFEHPLYDKYYEYIYNIFSKDYINGFYFFDLDLQDKDVIYNIQSLLEESGLTTHIVTKGNSNRNLMKISLGLLSNIYFCILLFSLFFISANLLLSYYIILLNQQKTIMIHSLFGATKLNIIHKYSLEKGKYIVLGTILAALLYYLYFLGSNLSLGLNKFSVVVFIGIWVNYFLFILVFFVKKLYKNVGWW